MHNLPADSTDILEFEELDSSQFGGLIASQKLKDDSLPKESFSKNDINQA